MADIVWLLRNDCPCNGDIGCAQELCNQAADEIERLKDGEARLRAALRFYAGWPQGPEGNIAPLLLDSGAIARAALEGPQDRIGTGGDE